MIYILAIACFAALAQLGRMKVRVPPGPAGFTSILVRNAYEFALPFSVTVWAYATFSAVMRIELQPDSVDLRLLSRAHEFAAAFEPLLAFFKLPKVLFLLALGLLFLYSIVLTRDDPLGRAARTMSPLATKLGGFLILGRKFNKTLSSLIAWFTAATLFTFFGPVPGQAQTDLQARLNSLNQVLGGFEQELDQVIREQVVAELLSRALEVLPQEYQTELRRYSEDAGKVRDVMNEKSVSEAVEADASLRRAVRFAIDTRGAMDGQSPRRDVPQPLKPADAGGLSAEAIQDMRKLLEDTGSRKASFLLATEVGRQLVRELMPYVFDMGDIIGVDRIERVAQPLKPLARTVTGSIDDAIKARIDLAATALRTRIMQAGRSYNWDKHPDTVKAEITADVPMKAGFAESNAALALATAMAAVSTRLASIAASVASERAAAAKAEESRRVEARREAALRSPSSRYESPYRPPPTRPRPRP